MNTIDPDDQPYFPCGHPRTQENSYFAEGRYCKTCDYQRSRAFRKRNPDYNKLYLREWRIRKRLGIERSKCLLTETWKPHSQGNRS